MAPGLGLFTLQDNSFDNHHGIERLETTPHWIIEKQQSTIRIRVPGSLWAVLKIAGGSPSDWHRITREKSRCPEIHRQIQHHLIPCSLTSTRYNMRNFLPLLTHYPQSNFECDRGTHPANPSVQYLAGHCTDITLDLGKITHCTSCKSHCLSRFWATVRWCLHKTLASFLQSDGTSLPGGEGLVDMVWYMSPFNFNFCYNFEPEVTDDSDLGNLCEVHDLTEPLFWLIALFSPCWKLIDLSMPFSIYKKLESQVSNDILPLLQSFKGRFDWNPMGVEDTSYLPTHFLEVPNL